MKKYDITLSEKELANLVPKISIAYSDFNGSLRHTITLAMRSFDQSLRKIIKDEAALAEIDTYLRKKLENELYFNESDLDNPKLEHIIKFIDRVYDPADNAEFVTIYPVDPLGASLASGFEKN